MELINLLIQAGVGVIALIILREFQKDRAHENERRDTREELERDRNQKNHQEFMLLLGALMGKQTETKTAIEASEGRVVGRVAGAETNILEVAAKMQKTFNLVFDMFFKDPPAAAEQLDRFMAAINVGDVQKAQAISDEPGEGPSKATLIVPPPAPSPSMEMRQ